jgi:2-isopropylmalate synthase
VIRINSQSGKGGMAHVLERDYGYRIPKVMAADFSDVVQEVTDHTGEELAPSAMVQLFRSRYFRSNGVRRVQGLRIGQGPSESERVVEAEVHVNDQWHAIKGCGGGPIEAFAQGLHDVVPGVWDIVYYTEHARTAGAAAEAVAYVGVSNPDDTRPSFGIGEDRDVVMASCLAILAALERLQAEPR